MIVIAKKFRAGKRNPFETDLWETVRNNWELVLLSLLLLGGMLCGALLTGNAGFDTINRLDFLFAGNFKARISEPFLAIFAASFASSFLFIFGCFLCGLSMWGVFLVPFILVFRGFGLGLASGYLYSVYGGKGILFNLAVILPGAFVSCLSILLASREGIRFSRRLTTSCGSESLNRPQIGYYLLRFGAILGIAFCAAIIDLVLSACLSGFFSF